MGILGILIGSLFLGEWLLTDVVHLSGTAIGLSGAAIAVWLLSKPRGAKFEPPDSFQGWLRRCKEVLEQFEPLEEEDNSYELRMQRAKALEAVLDRSEELRIAFVSSDGVELPKRSTLESAFADDEFFKLSFASSSLSLSDQSWIWPEFLYEEDLLLYFLPLPLRAADFLWLDKIPGGQPSWLVVLSKDSDSWENHMNALKAQLPPRWSNSVLRWNESNQEGSEILEPIRERFKHRKTIIEETRKRMLSRLHSSWQNDLENLRRKKFSTIQQKTQWIVAGAVFASPVPSADLLIMTVVNGLMVKEMAKIWSCSWKVEVLNTVARELAGVAVAQGVVEWSTQALLGMAKLHGTSWLAAGTLQSLSAAYLTRVVGRSMADWLALNNGVDAIDLEALKLQAPQLVANAAEHERVDWGGFIKQSLLWLNDKNVASSDSTTLYKPS